MHRMRARRWAKCGQFLKEIDHIGRRIGRRDHADNTFGARNIAIHGQHKRACAPRALIIAPHQRIKTAERAIPVPRYAERQGQAPRRFIRGQQAQRGQIVFLGTLWIAGQIIGQATICRDIRLRRAQSRGFIKKPQGVGRFFHLRQAAGKASLCPPIAR